MDSEPKIKVGPEPEQPMEYVRIGLVTILSPEKVLKGILPQWPRNVSQADRNALRLREPGRHEVRARAIDNGVPLPARLIAGPEIALLIGQLGWTPQYVNVEQADRRVRRVELRPNPQEIHVGGFPLAELTNCFWEDPTRKYKLQVWNNPTPDGLSRVLNLRVTPSNCDSKLPLVSLELAAVCGATAIGLLVPVVHEENKPPIIQQTSTHGRGGDIPPRAAASNRPATNAQR